MSTKQVLRLSEPVFDTENTDTVRFGSFLLVFTQS